MFEMLRVTRRAPVGKKCSRGALVTEKAER